MEQTLAVIGITGHSGRFFLQELEAHAYPGKIRCLVRPSSDTALLDRSPLRIEKLVGDNGDEQTLLRLTDGADVVMHISNIRKSVGVLQACIRNRVPRVVMVHTTGIYSKYKMASGEYRRIEAEIETLMKTAELDLTILRPTMIFGDLCDHNIHKFIRMVDRLPFMPEINRGRGRIRPVNARDLARAYYACCMTKGLPERCYDLSGERSLSQDELFRLIGKYLGKRVRCLSCPLWLGAFGARCVKALSLGKADYVEKVLRMSEDRDYDHAAAARDFGYAPEQFDLGLEREVRQYTESRKGQEK